MDDVYDELYENVNDGDDLAVESIEYADEPEESLVPGIDGKSIPPDAAVYQLHINCSHETIYAAYNESELKPGTMTVVSTRYGKDLARLTGRICRNNLQNISKITRIDRLATESDLEKDRNNRQKEDDAFKICKQKIIEHNLAMKLVTVHFLIDEPKILFFFTAESRVDFRELVKDLVTIFKIRIELRQIGIRDDARMTGGFGICGRSFCCHSISDKLKPVAIKMAKEQNLSLNSMKISGHCGRLLCCLAYEHGTYAEQRRTMPAEGAKIMRNGALWKVIEVNAVLCMITLASESGQRVTLPKTKFEKIDTGWKIKD
ncbi:MAG: hypothetical protein LBB22_05485 [Treponema sp.]|jgi:cell fate regulator YaaT (PSP1 superfamily)|nr:hypothetical protein [Treponema sp.]